MDDFPIGTSRSSPPFVILQPEVRHGAPCLLSVRSGAAGVRHLHISLLFALLLGYVIFALYAIRKGFSLPEVLGMSAQGVPAAKNILTTFVLIGILTSLWRAGGTIPAIVCYSVRVMEPRLFLVCSFLLNCLVSFLTGTAFGSAATMGAVCMTMAAALGADPLMTGGAILSGVYFGDRCSPVSTSALLVADLTGTDLFGNIRQMLRTCLVPFALAAGLYLLFGLSSPPPVRRRTSPPSSPWSSVWVPSPSSRRL